MTIPTFMRIVATRNPNSGLFKPQVEGRDSDTDDWRALIVAFHEFPTEVQAIDWMVPEMDGLREQQKKWLVLDARNSRRIGWNPMATPFVSFGNDELEPQPPLADGDQIVCPHCDKNHTVEAGTDDKGVKSGLLLFYRCGKKLYLAGVAGKSVVKLFPRTS